MKKKLSKLWLIPAVSALGMSGNAAAFELYCNESASEGKNCGVEVKCYSDDIEGGIYLDIGEFDAGAIVFHEFYNTAAETFICGGENFINLEQTPKYEMRCTENARGKDNDGDIAVEVELNLAGCD